MAHLNPSMIAGNQKWRGPAPIFINNDEFKIVVKDIEIITELTDLIEVKEKSRADEAMARVTK